MKAGALDQRVTLLMPTYASSTQSGQGVASYSATDTVSASVKALGGSELLAAQSITSEVQYEVQIRFRADVTPKYRLSWTPYSGTAKTFEVHAVQVSDRRDGGMVLLCGVRE